MVENDSLAPCRLVLFAGQCNPSIWITRQEADHQGNDLMGHILQQIVPGILKQVGRGMGKPAPPHVEIVQIEDKIVFIVAYSWTWDLDYTKESASRHRNKLVNLYAPHGFKEYPTNDPNVTLRPENIFMARIGKSIFQFTPDFISYRFLLVLIAGRGELHGKLVIDGIQFRNPVFTPGPDTQFMSNRH